VGFIRNILPVTDVHACITTAAAVSVATYMGKWACAQGQIWDPKQVPNSSGDMVASCWRCPTQSGRSMYAVDTAKACAGNSFRWNTPAYNEPGLFGLRTMNTAQPVATFLSEVFGSAVGIKGLTGFLYAYRESKGETGAALDAAVAQEWQLIATDPASSAALKAYVYAYLEALGTGGTALSANDQALVSAWEGYVRARRIYIAQDARNAYEAWKLADAWVRQQQADLLGNAPNMFSLFDYGRVPPKFADNAQAQLTQGFTQAAVTVAATGALGTPAVANAAQLSKFMFPFRKAPAFIGGAGPQIIIMVAMVVLEIAIDQIIDISTMDARLTSTLELASRAFSLSAKLAEKDGKEKMVSAWAVAVNPSTPPPPSALLTAAASARAAAAAANYWSTELR
jgi:hypothetical protein